jgi:hypothetical protein
VRCPIQLADVRLAEDGEGNERVPTSREKPILRQHSNCIDKEDGYVEERTEREEEHVARCVRVRVGQKWGGLEWQKGLVQSLCRSLRLRGWMNVAFSAGGQT